jgi:GNAT superfamily N-acetyltransferase
MNKNSFENTIYKNWMNYFGCPVETSQQYGTTLLPENKYDGDKIIALWYIGKHTFVQLDPAYHPKLDRLVQELPPNTSISGEYIENVWGREAMLSRDFGLIHYLFPQNLPDYLPAPPFSLRQLGEADADTMSELHTANTPEDVDEGYVEVSHQIVYGCFQGGQLVAAASGYERTGFLDVGVLTHPGFRKKGLAKAVVGALCDWANRHGMIAQYRHNLLNMGSQSVARSLNFQMYFKSEGISIR